MKRQLFAALALAGAFAAPSAIAEITIGISLGATGPTSSMGIPYKNALLMMPKTLGGEPVKYIILDDESKPDNAAKNARKLVVEDKADAIMGSTSVPSVIAMSAVAAESRVPMIAFTPVPELPPDRQHWTFAVPQTIELMMSAITEHMRTHGIKTVGYIGFSDTWGDMVYNAITALAAPGSYKVIANERYGRADCQGHFNFPHLRHSKFPHPVGNRCRRETGPDRP